MNGAQPRAVPRWVPAGAALLGLAALVVYTLRDVLAPGNARLPGADASNIYIWEFLTRAALFSGRLPHWNPYHLAGTPHLSDPMTTVFYPPALALRWLPPVAFVGWTMALHLMIAGGGALYLSRAIGMRWGVAAAVAAAVALGGSVGAWIHNGHVLVLQSTAWLPWALGLAIASVRRGRWLPHPGLIVVLVLQFLAGYLQGSVYVAAAVGSYFVFAALWPDDRAPAVSRVRPLAQLAFVILLAGGLSAVQLLPTLTLIGEAGRTSGLPYEVALEGAWSARDVVTILFPFLGVEDIPTHRYLADRVAYVGWVLACAVPFAFVDRPRRRLALFFALLTLATLIFALGDRLGAYRLHYALVPGLRIPGRLLFVATVSLAALGGLGLERLLTLVDLRRWRTIAMCALWAAAPAAVATSIATGSATVPMHGWPWLPVVLVSGAAGLVGLATLAGPRPAMGLALALVVLDMTTFSAGAVATVPVTAPGVVQTWLGPPRAGRALTVCENQIGAGEFLINREPTVDGLAGIHLRGYSDWAYLTKFGESPPDDGIFRRIGTEDGRLPARRDLLDLANVTSVVACAALDDPALSLTHRHDPFHVFRNERARPRAFWTCSADEVTRQTAIRELLRGRYDTAGHLQPQHYLNVRWAPHIADDERVELERRHQLVEGVRLEGATWRYVLDDRSRENITAMLASPDIEDTHGVDRETGALIALPEDAASHADDDEGGPERLVGRRPCEEDGDVRVTTADQLDGRVVALVSAPVDGFVFFSEPFYSERKAFVDGAPVTPARANLAFIALPVTAGQHRVELRMIPRSFHVGLAVTGLTLAGWLGVLFLTRR